MSMCATGKVLFFMSCKRKGLKCLFLDIFKLRLLIDCSVIFYAFIGMVVDCREQNTFKYSQMVAFFSISLSLVSLHVIFSFNLIFTFHIELSIEYIESELFIGETVFFCWYILYSNIQTFTVRHIPDTCVFDTFRMEQTNNQIDKIVGIISDKRALFSILGFGSCVQCIMAFAWI